MLLSARTKGSVVLVLEMHARGRKRAAPLHECLPYRLLQVALLGACCGTWNAAATVQGKRA